MSNPEWKKEKLPYTWRWRACAGRVWGVSIINTHFPIKTTFIWNGYVRACISCSKLHVPSCCLGIWQVNNRQCNTVLVECGWIWNMFVWRYVLTSWISGNNGSHTRKNEALRVKMGHHKEHHQKIEWGKHENVWSMYKTIDEDFRGKIKLKISETKLVRISLIKIMFHFHSHYFVSQFISQVTQNTYTIYPRAPLLWRIIRMKIDTSMKGGNVKRFLGRWVMR